MNPLRFNLITSAVLKLSVALILIAQLVELSDLPNAHKQEDANL